MGFVVDLGPGAASNSVFGKQMHSATQVFIASPALMALAMFSGTLGHWVVTLSHTLERTARPDLPRTMARTAVWSLRRPTRFSERHFAFKL
jgi:hypothetical protein